VARADVARTIETVWRLESARLIASLTRLVRDVGLAEDLAQEALVAALEQWPRSGIPDNPGAWLVTVGKRRGIDRIRQAEIRSRRAEEIGRELALDAAAGERDLAAAADDPFDDDLLRLIFTVCHPVLAAEARVALALRLLGGLSTAEIARAYLVAEPTVAQRIVRAKRTLAESRATFDVPTRDQLEGRLAAVLESIYLIFNEGYAPSAGDAVVRVELVEEALRLGRILAALLPDQPEVHGLASLMELHASRLHARVGAYGGAVLLLDQDRARWDWVLVERGLAAFERAAPADGALGPYGLQAGIAACHARARRPEDTDWVRIVALYDGLAELTGSPVVELNRAVAIGFAFGPEPALELVEAIADEPTLRGYHLLAVVRGDLLERLGRDDEARREFEAAAQQATNASQRRVLEARVEALA